VARSTGSSSGGGCGTLIAFALLVAGIVAAAISLAALLDPFDWMPSVHTIWADCDGECALAHRFPGFWWHVIANLAYAAVAVAVTIRFLATVLDVRKTRVTRYADAAAMDAYRTAHNHCVVSGKLLGALASVSIIAWMT
jgi:hypothetical protein